MGAAILVFGARTSTGGEILRSGGEGPAPASAVVSVGNFAPFGGFFMATSILGREGPAD